MIRLIFLFSLLAAAGFIGAYFGSRALSKASASTEEAVIKAKTVIGKQLEKLLALINKKQYKKAHQQVFKIEDLTLRYQQEWSEALLTADFEKIAGIKKSISEILLMVEQE